MKKLFPFAVIILLTVSVQAQTVLTAAKLVYNEENFIDMQDGRTSKRANAHSISFSDQYLKKERKESENVLAISLLDAKNNRGYFYLTDYENYYYLDEENMPTFFSLGLYEQSTPSMKLLNETATINGFNCKKAIFEYDVNGIKEQIEVWYTTDYKLEAAHLGYSFKDLPGLPVKFKLKMLNSIQMSMGANGKREFSLVSLEEIRPAEAAAIENKERYKYLDYNERQNIFMLINLHGSKNRPTPQKKGEAIEESITSANGSSIKVLRYNPFKVGEILSDFETKDVNGNKKTLASYKDKIIVLNFWFTECAPCIKEMPYLNSLTEKYKDKDIVFVSMTFNKQEEVKKFLKKHTFKFENLTDAREIVEGYGVSSYPLTLIADKNKIIQYVRTGEANEELEVQLNKLTGN
ncbi:redoxin domain-containing protein [Gynurincola endophyticus]|uniref:redoxin domain-containing protein n=1 Tax=Gynurincola endophyticus TaxID=2479004 RepID=UPI000F8DF076|nr:redoxin domain-containing protein [Gynurincola endophyticus]